MTKRSEIEREDILALLEIASDMNRDAPARLLTEFCRVNKHVRFASIWRHNCRSETISIVSRSESDYLPQLGSNGENSQEFVCSTECPSVKGIISGKKFKRVERENHSIRQSKKYGTFHPELVVEEYKLDHFICVPIHAAHAPSITETRGPKYFCLLYCPLGTEASSVADDDLELIRTCLGNIIYNRFNQNRWQRIEEFTSFLSTNHDPDADSFLEQLRECLPCEAVFEISRSAGEVIISSARSNRRSLSKKAANKLWNLSFPSDTTLFSKKELSELEISWARSAIVYQTLNHEADNRSIILYCNRVSQSPHASKGLKTFSNDFGFDDVILAESIGEHVRAFSLTKAERKRRADTTRIIAHEIKQPLIDIRNGISNHELFPRRFSLNKTLERVKDSTNLALMLAEINTDLSDERIVSLVRKRAQTLDVNLQLEIMRKSIRSLCEDNDYKNDNIDIVVDSSCEQLRMSKPLLATVFLNTVSNSIKYSGKSFEDGWCTVRVNSLIRDEVRRLGAGRRSIPRDGILVTTTDNGRGVPKDEVEKVFQKETRLHHPQAVPGLGLGLFHLRRIVTTLGGDVWIQAGDAQSGFSTRVFTALPSAAARSLL